MKDLIEKFKDESLSPLEAADARVELIRAARSLRRELVRELARERSQSLKIELLKVLGATLDPSFEGAIRRVIESEKSEEVLQTAATSLGKVRGKNSFPVLVALLNHESRNVRLGAVFGLSALGDKVAIKYLVNCLDDHAPVRCWWPSPKVAGYSVASEASIAIDALAGERFLGDKANIEKWINDHFK